MPASHTPLPLAVKLPAELLSLIFQVNFILQTEAAEAIKSDVEYWSAQDIIHYSHVCQYWRDVALSTPALWTHCDVYHKGFSEFCKRSMPLPIHVSAWSSWHRPEIFVGAVSTTLGSLLNEAYRIKSLTMIGCPLLISKLIAVCPTLPILSWLRLWCLDDENHLPVFLPVSPNIRRLDLGKLNTNLSPFTHLTHLTLEQISSEDDMCPMGRQIVELLGRSSGLRQLVLFDIRLTAPAITMNPVQLVYLETLSLEYVEDDLLIFIVSHLSIPSTAPLVSSRFCLDINFIEKSISSDPSHLLISADHPDSISSIMPILPSSIDFSLATNLRITYPAKGGMICPPTNVWIMLFAGLPSVDDLLLEIPDKWLDLVLQALGSGSSHRGKCQCPALRILRIGDSEGDDILPDPVMVLECLRARSRAGMVPLELEMNYYVSEIRDIRRLVRDLTSFS